MPGPARAGLFIYANDPDRVARFYEAIASMTRVRQSDEIIVLQSPDMQLLIHQIPPHIAADITISTPPARRDDTALKFFFTVPDLQTAGETLSSLGGVMFSERWDGPGFVACNAMDPEGNVMQLRQMVG